MLKDLVADIGDQPYSLIVDESTDFSVDCKFLCLCVKYFSIKFQKHLTEYLVMLPVDASDHETLYIAITNYCDEIGLNLNNLIGLGTDGGTNLCGKNNSVYAKLKQENPKLQLVRCICHALNNAASAASSKFPAAIEFLCREVYNFFSKSHQRKKDFKEVWLTLNSSPDKDYDPMEEITKEVLHKYIHLSDTRWLARYNVVKVLLLNYLALKTYFDSYVRNLKDPAKNKDQTARLLDQYLKDESNYLFLLIIKPILSEVNLLNTSFQKTNVDLGSAHENLAEFLLLLGRKIFKTSFLDGGIDILIQNQDNSLAFKQLSDINFGIDYRRAMEKDYKNKISLNKKTDIETRAFDYLKSLFIEVAKRFPEKMKFYKKLKFLSPEVCLSRTSRPEFSELPFLNIFVDEEKLSTLENQYEKLLCLDWKSLYDVKVFDNSYIFWSTVFFHKNASGNYMLQELAHFALTLLSPPSSNAVVERVFSVMNVVKTKLRNRIQIKMLDSVIRIRITLYAHDTCCDKFIPSNQMIEDCKTEIVYPASNKQSNSTEDIDKELEILYIFQEFNYPCVQIPE